MRQLILLFICIFLFGNGMYAQSRSNMPWVDISSLKSKQIVIAQGTKDLYNGHPTTVMLDDNKTMYCVWTNGHGGRVAFLAVSGDGGLTWKQQQIPEDWSKTANCPSIYKLTDKEGKERLMIFAGSPNMSQTYSEDGGKTWSPVRSLDKPCVMAFASIVKLNNGDYLGMYHRGANDQDRHPLTLWQSISSDGGLTWGPSVQVGKKDNCSPCEPCIIRSPDGNQLACIVRENRRTGHSLMMFSNDEGKTWTDLRETPWGLSGDRHVIKYVGDRLVAVFRDVAPNSPTNGHFVAWVGTYKDILNNGSGQYRIKLIHNYDSWDCGYPGLEILPDGTIVATTYVKYTPGKEKQSVVSVRFNLNETDKMAAKL